MESKYSIVEYLSDSHSSCGYCKSKNSNHSNGMWAHTMNVEDYQVLIDRGWRRSGLYCYKPVQTSTCCPLYTIRCEALNFQLTKSQKKILKKVRKFLNDGITPKTKHSEDVDSDSGGEMESANDFFDKSISKVIEEKSNEKIEELMEVDASAKKEPEQIHAEESIVPNNKENNRKIEESSLKESQENHGNLEKLKNNVEKSCVKIPKPGVGRDMSKPQCKKAKLLRLEKKQKKMIEKGLVFDDSSKKAQNLEKSLEDFIEENASKNPVQKLELRLVRSFPWSREFEETFEEEHLVYQKYQVAVHNDPITKVTEQQFKRFLVTSPLKMRLLPSNSKEILIKESWNLFRKYQMVIHNEQEDECSYRTFNSFLVETPLKPQQRLKGNSSVHPGYGSFHQQYRLDGKLIAVGVIDILPKCISSVYFFYDPDYSFLSLGTYGSLRELELARSLNKESSELCYYYMGYYVHTCPKMRYKARYSPSSLLCPEVYTWHPIVECQRKLDKAKYSRFNDDIDAICEDNFIVLNEVLILHNQIAMSFSIFKMRAVVTQQDEEEIKEYAELVGRKCAEKMLLYRSKKKN